MRADVNDGMRLKPLQIIVALAAAIAFCLAFIATGVVLLSAFFMVVGLACIAALAWSFMRQTRVQLRHERRQASRDTP